MVLCEHYRYRSPVITDCAARCAQLRERFIGFRHAVLLPLTS